MRAALFAFVVMLAGGPASADKPPPPRPWLGVSITDTGVRWGGIAILDVFEDTPAWLCGIQAGDEIYAIDHVEVHGTAELQVSVGAHAVGDRIRVEYIRGDALRRCSVRLAEAITDPTELIQRRLVDRAIPPFTLVRHSDDAVFDDLSTRGDVLALALISTACETCVATLSALATALDGTNVPLYAVSDDGEAAVDAFIQRTGANVEILREDRDLAAPARGLVERYRADRDDATILLIDHEGVVTFAAVGQGVEGANLDGVAFSAERAARARRKAR